MYDFLYSYYGINKQFKSNPTLFEIKKSAEDSLIHLAKEALPQDSLVSLQALVFVSSNSSRPFVSDYVLKYTTKSGVSFDHMNEILKKKGISEKHLIGSTGSYSQIFGSVEMTPFDESFMRSFLTYISTYPDSEDLQFLKNLSKYDYPDASAGEIDHPAPV